MKDFNKLILDLIPGETTKQKYEKLDEIIHNTKERDELIEYFCRLNIRNMLADKWVKDKNLPFTFWEKFILEVTNEVRSPNNFLDIVIKHFKDKI